MNLKTKLTTIQNELKVGKELKNNFGNYNYRNAEMIFEALKPLLVKFNVSVIVSDAIELIGDRFYIKATATIFDNDESDFNSGGVSVTAYAREAISKKGMDDAQITGSASSYARKYALSGLFLLDDSRDIDSMEHKDESRVKNPALELTTILKKAGLNKNDIIAFMQSKGVTSNDTGKLDYMIRTKEQTINEATAFLAHIAQNQGGYDNE